MFTITIICLAYASAIIMLTLTLTLVFQLKYSCYVISSDFVCRNV